MNQHQQRYPSSKPSPAPSPVRRSAALWRGSLAAGIGVLLLLVLDGRPTSIHAQDEDAATTSREYAIKAAYLYQFCRYVEWPSQSFADAAAPLVIGVLGMDPFGAILDEIARTKRIENRPIAIRRFASAANYEFCHILFVASSAGPEQTAAVVKKTRGTPVLLVGEEPGFAEHGGTGNFFQEDNRICFEINVEAAKRNRLKISSKLLSLAKIIGR